MKFVVVRILSGILLILAGVFGYFGVGFVAALPLILLVGGVGIILLALGGHRPSAPDLALFAVSLLVLGGVAAGLSSNSGGSVIYTVRTSQVSAQAIDIRANVGTGSFGLRYSDDPGLVYLVNFTKSFGFGFFIPATYSLSNRTAGGTLFLNATSDSYGIDVILGRSFDTSVTVDAGTGSINVRAPEGNIKAMSLSTGTGSIDATLGSATLSSLEVRTGTGSIHVDASSVAAAEKGVPFTVTAGTGSVDVQVSFANGSAVSLSASTGFGSLSHSLQGFTVTQSSSNSVTANAGVPEAPRSFNVDVSTGTGSLSVIARVLG